MNASKKEIVDCPKCSGAGRIQAFGHYAAGVCFECGGVGRFAITAATSAEIAASARRNAHDLAVRALAHKIGLTSDGKTYSAVGSLIMGAHEEHGIFLMPASAGSFSASPAGRRLAAAYAEAVSIIDAAAASRTIRPAQVARLAEIAAMMPA